MTEPGLAVAGYSLAITNLFPQARSVGAWLSADWHVALASVVGFAAMLVLAGWHPHRPQGPAASAAVPAPAPMHDEVQR